MSRSLRSTGGPEAGSWAASAGVVGESPRLPDRGSAPEHPAGSGLTVIGADQVAAVVSMAHEFGASRIAVGSGRDRGSRESAGLIASAWQEQGGEVLTVVDWPERAASWMRPARRLSVHGPDLWVLGGPAPGLAQLVRRLAWSSQWLPARTIGFGSTIEATAQLVGHGLMDGVRGADDTGRRWRVDHGRMQPDHR